MIHKKFFLIVAITALLAGVLAACSTDSPAPSNTPPAPTENIQATIDAGVQSTVQAEANMQATIDAAVTATVAAAEAAEPEISEEEMAVEIDAAVTEAVTATEEIAAVTEEIVADGVVTQDEYDELEALLVDAAVLIDYAEYWIETYYWYYGDLAEETLVLLEEIEEVLYYTEEYYDELITLMETSTEIADAALDALLQAADNAEQTAAVLAEKTETWQAQAAAWQQTRAEQFANIQPNNIPQNRGAALQEARNYLEALTTSLQDQVISLEELQNIAQIGANAVAGLEAHGGAALQEAAGMITQLTQQAAMGQFGQVANGLGGLEAAIPGRP